MPSLNDILEIIKQKLPDLQAVYLFGSYGTSYQTSESDLDLAVLTATHINPIEKWHLSQEIARDIGRDVDIVDLRKASTILRTEIINSGKRLFCKDPIETDLFETAVFSSYVHFNEDRQALLTDIKKRGGQILHG